MNRRDKVYLVAKRAWRLTGCDAAKAWGHLALDLETIAKTDMPKFRDLLRAIRRATIAGRRDERSDE